jgi:hypothetical protein
VTCWLSNITAINLRIDGYENDDRMLALEIQQRLKPTAAVVEMRELNDVD